MSPLPYRSWNFRDGNASQISALTEPERKSDDRSPFVRYARSAALWAEWVREETVAINPESNMPTVEVDGLSFKFAIVDIASLRPTMSVPPSAKDHYQRLLESTQLYVEPIIVTQDGYVVGNHELFAAAKAYQAELTRPNKIRPSDYCLVATVESAFLKTIETEAVYFWSVAPSAEIVKALLSAGYAVSPRADDPTQLVIQIDDQILAIALPSGGDWKQELGPLIGVRSLDLGSRADQSAAQAGKTKIKLLCPPLDQIVQKSDLEFPYGALVSTIKPFPGANMWSLRDFRVE